MDEAGDYALALSIALAVEADAALIASLLEDDHQTQKDRQIAIRLADAPGEDIELIVALLEADEQAERDHLLALRLDENPDAMPAETGICPRDCLDDETYDLLKVYNAYVDHEDYPVSIIKGKGKMKACIVCRDDFPEIQTTEVPCFHTLCRTCFVTLINTTLNDESLFPPKCCGQPIPITASNHSRFITESMVTGFEEKKIEFETVDRTYCSNAKCSNFIPPSFTTEDTASCTVCWATTCVRCKRPGHRGLCPVDDVSQKVLDLEEKRGWKRCVKCGHLIELTLGCNHMVCSCGHEFCYVCGGKWKTCLCRQVDEERLYNRRDAIGGDDDDDSTSDRDM
ncbi:uncharacterized protein B0J16DRAFT_387116 [Fusarium flagelliforme]|uniref:uncharacterized protein n=1 Tax=Fusarium flagelliforme TaxID=2675880 RepID=UPI001E8EDED9|nr:uncharacterized protein B0J16DRAFT_387116 [Fusarium flagelliforme]KAH7179283.1 hypothetical protein B0J16DRAFT_387116 [Fusarium flagelliforme]